MTPNLMRVLLALDKVDQTAVSPPLGHFPTIFQAEVYSINLCARINLKKGMKGATIDIISDSQAALKALIAYECDSRLVWCLCMFSYRKDGQATKVYKIEGLKITREKREKK